MASMEELLNDLLDGKQVEFAYSNGLLRSSKTAWREDEDHYVICHEIDGTLKHFTKLAIIEVFKGERDAWDGDIESDENTYAVFYMEEDDVFKPDSGGLSLDEVIDRVQTYLDEGAASVRVDRE